MHYKDFVDFSLCHLSSNLGYFLFVGNLGCFDLLDMVVASVASLVDLPCNSLIHMVLDNNQIGNLHYIDHMMPLAFSLD